MNFRKLATAAIILSMSLPVTALAQDNGDATEDLELTIRLLPRGAEEGSEVTRTITLPDSVPERVSRTVPGENAENAGQGDGATGERGRSDDLPDVDAPGLDVAEDAISGEGGRDFGQEMRDRMNDNREERGRGQAREDLPAPDNPGADPGRPDDVPRPDRPDTPDTPDTPAGPPGD